MRASPLAFAAAIAGAGAPALSCPATPADSAVGILVTYDDASTARIVLDPATGDAVEVSTYADGYIQRLQLVLGLYTIRSTQLDAQGNVVPGTEGTFAYTPARPDRLAPGLQWQSATVITQPDGVTEGSLTLTFGTETETVIGECRLRSWPVTMLSQEPAFAMLVQVDYLPDLQISIVRAYGEPMGTTTTVTPTRIEVIR